MPAKARPKKSKSVLKRTRQAKVKTLKNQSVKNKLKTLAKKVEGEVLNKNLEGAKTALNSAIRAIDKAKIKRIIPRNTAARKVSRLSRLVNSLLPA
ncbi:MAG: 30S ribosomal protein S20 [Nitrospirae bacterium]|nr:30S ribosomal protein S20 [Nitrospirota bacterium]